CEEPLNIAVIGNEAVDQLARGIGVKKGRADHSQLERREDTLVDQGLLDDVDREPARVAYGVGERNRQDDPHSIASVQAVDLGAILHRQVGTCREIFQHRPSPSSTVCAPQMQLYFILSLYGRFVSLRATWINRGVTARERRAQLERLTR